VDGLQSYHVVAGQAPVLAHNTCLPALRDWSSQRHQFGNQQLLLDRSDMRHILSQHHPTYWDGSTRRVQTFFDPSMGVGDVQAAIASVLRQNREAIIRQGMGTGRGYTVVGRFNGVEYVAAIRGGHVRTFYPVPR
jgi:hypothetical protein